MKKGNELLGKLKDYFEECRKLMPDVIDDMLCDDGDGEKIYYMNWNRGTKTEWLYNQRLSEFCMFFKKTARVFVKIYVNSDDTMSAEMYAEESKKEDEPLLKPETVKLNKGDANYFAVLMDQIADERERYNKPISALNFGHEVRGYEK